MLKILAGSNSINGDANSLIAVNKVFQHPLHNITPADYDVSVIYLNTSVPSNFSSHIMLAGSDDELPSGSMGTVTGWGRTQEGGSLSTQLQKLNVPVIPQRTCESFYEKYNVNFTERMLCAGFAEGKKDSCQGDSGGPLVYKNKQFGIVSFGVGCARENLSGAYTYVPKVRDFIDDAIRKSWNNPTTTEHLLGDRASEDTGIIHLEAGTSGSTNEISKNIMKKCHQVDFPIKSFYAENRDAAGRMTMSEWLKVDSKSMINQTATDLLFKDMGIVSEDNGILFSKARTEIILRDMFETLPVSRQVFDHVKLLSELIFSYYTRNRCPICGKIIRLW